MTGVLNLRQRAAADRLLDEESAKRSHLVVSLSGAHAYGFPSPDSDLNSEGNPRRSNGATSRPVAAAVKRARPIGDY